MSVGFGVWNWNLLHLTEVDFVDAICHILSELVSEQLWCRCGGTHKAAFYRMQALQAGLELMWRNMQSEYNAIQF